MNIAHIILDIVRNSILITGLVTIMMMLIESLNIESRALLFSGLKKSRIGQVVFSAFLGALPGCMGGFASVSLYTHKIISFGALTAMMIASSGDETFMIMAMLPEQSIMIFSVLFVIAVITGVATDMVFKPKGKNSCTTGYTIHEEAVCKVEKGKSHKKERHLTKERMVMFIAVAVFIAALLSGILDHGHAEHLHYEEHSLTINLLNKSWMNWMFALLGIVLLGFLIFSSDHFIKEHLWEHIVLKHVPNTFLWVIGVLSFVDIGLQFIDISKWMSHNTALMIVIASLVGMIPESGPHLVFVTLYASGIVPLPVLMASCISQDGHASIPLIAESKKSFAAAKLLNAAVAMATGLIMMLL